MLRMTQVGKTYISHTVETSALRNVSMEVAKSEFIAVTGPSGSGKTTFLNIAGLLEPASSGQILLDGQNLLGLNDDAMSVLRNEKIGFVFQRYNLIANLNLLDNLEVPLRYRRMTPSERQRRVKRALDQVGLSSRARHYPAQLSGGQKQRAAIARALAGDPQLLLADEPTGNLDSTMAAEIMLLLKAVNDAGTTIIMVTHDPAMAANAQRQVYLRDGQVSAVAP